MPRVCVPCCVATPKKRMVELTLDIGIAYGALLTMALIPIYIGAHSSLKQKMVCPSSSSNHLHHHLSFLLFTNTKYSQNINTLQGINELKRRIHGTICWECGAVWFIRPLPLLPQRLHQPPPLKLLCIVWYLSTSHHHTSNL